MPRLIKIEEVAFYMDMKGRFPPFILTILSVMD